MKTFKMTMSFLLVASLGWFTSCKDSMEEIREDAAGEAAAPLPVTTVGNGTEFTIQTNTTWTNDRIWLLDGFVKFKNASLTIQPGTIIKGTDGTSGAPGTLVIERSATLIAQGTPAQPIIFTSNRTAGNRAPGDWGGIIWCGNAFVNVTQGVNGAPINYIGNIEGVPAGVSEVRYGSGVGDPSVNATENNGVLSYARIEYAGSVLSEGDETNGLTLGGLGNGTTINHIQISYASDDAYEWFGGTVDQKHLIAFATQDDDFDVDQGYLGRTQYGIILRDPSIFGTGSGGSRGFEANGDDDDAKNLIIFTDAMFSHITNLGPNGPRGTACTQTYAANEYNDGVVVRDRAKIDVYNSVHAGYPRYAVFFDFPNDFNNKLTSWQGNRFVAPNIPGADGSNLSFAQITGTQNESVVATGCDNANDVATLAGLKRNAWRLTDPLLTLDAASILNSGATYTAPRYNTNNDVRFGGQVPFAYQFQNPNFFDQPSYRGAFGTTDGNWQLDQWTEWDPQTPAYN